MTLFEFITQANLDTIADRSGVNTGDKTATSNKTKYESNADTNFPVTREGEIIYDHKSMELKTLCGGVWVTVAAEDSQSRNVVPSLPDAQFHAPYMPFLDFGYDDIKPIQTPTSKRKYILEEPKLSKEEARCIYMRERKDERKKAK